MVPSFGGEGQGEGAEASYRTKDAHLRIAFPLTPALSPNDAAVGGEGVNVRRSRYFVVPSSSPAPTPPRSRRHTDNFAHQSAAPRRQPRARPASRQTSRRDCRRPVLPTRRPPARIRNHRVRPAAPTAIRTAAATRPAPGTRWWTARLRRVPTAANASRPAARRPPAETRRRGRPPR